jgi:hypothetical protein
MTPAEREKYRAWLLERFSPEEIRELAGAMLGTLR